MKIYETIENCPITKSTSDVRMPFIDTKSNIWYNRKGGYHTGIDLSATSVYTICAGVCTFVGKSNEERNVVIIQYDRNTSFRYCNLKSVSVSKGNIVTYQQQIGVAYKYVHFEVLTLVPSQWKVRVGNLDYYKNNPTTYALGQVDYSNSNLVEDFQYYDVDPSLQTVF